MSDASKSSDAAANERVTAAAIAGVTFGFIGGALNGIISDLADPLVRAPLRLVLIGFAFVIGAISAGYAFGSRYTLAIVLGAVLAALGLFAWAGYIFTNRS